MVLSLRCALCRRGVRHKPAGSTPTHPRQAPRSGLRRRQETHARHERRVRDAAPSFKDGEDPRWTAVHKNDYTNKALQYYHEATPLPSMVPSN